VSPGNLRQRGNVVGIILLGDLQRAYRAQQVTSRRHQLREFLVEQGEPTGDAFQIVARRLFVAGYVDNFGSAVLWLGSASLKERASLFSSIATDMLGNR